MYSCLNWVNGSEPYDRIMSYTRWKAFRATEGLSVTMSRYSQNDPSQCCSRNREVSILRSRMPTSGFDAVEVFAMVELLRFARARVARAARRGPCLARGIRQTRGCGRPRAPTHYDTRAGRRMERSTS